MTALADAYKMAIAASALKTTKATDKETQTFGRDCIKMVRFCANDNRVNNKMMGGLLRNPNKGYDDVIRQVKDIESKGINTNTKETSGDKRNLGTSSIAGALQDSGVSSSGKPGAHRKKIESMGHN